MLLAIEFDNLHQILRSLYTDMMPLCGNMAGTCVRLYLLAEGVVGQFPALDTRQLLFPFARHGNIGDAHRLDDGIEGKSFFGGNKRLLAAFHVTALEKRFDDGGACGGSTDATVLHRLPQCVVLNFLARRFHCREQGGFGMQRLGFGLSFGNGRAFRCQRVAFLPAGDGNFLFFLAIDVPAYIAMPR